MPPKFSKRNFSSNQANDKNKKERKVALTFLMVGNNRIGIEVPYKTFSCDNELKALIKNYSGVWDREERMWVLTHSNYQKVLDLIVEHCKKKEYYCSKIPSFVYDAQLDMPTDLVIKINNNKDPPVIRYIDSESQMDPETLPFYEKLYDFQKESLRFGIEHHGRLLLADEMGVGKTIQSLAIAFMYRYQWPMVIICPSTLRFNWLNEVLQWYGDYIKKNQVFVYTKGGSTLKDTTKVLVISYELAWKFKQIWSEFKIAIVDEAHYLKNSGCKRTDILVPELARKKRIILLTGTPAFARPREIFNLASIIRPDVFHNFIQFGNRYCDPSRNPWSGAIEYNGCVNSKELFFLLKNKIMLRRLKKEVLTQLPDKQRQKIIIETNKTIVKQINFLMDQNGQQMRKSEDLIMQMFGLRGMGGQKGDDIHKKKESLMQAYRLSGTAKLDGVVEYILSLLENDVKLLIFAHHRVVLDRIQSDLTAKKFKTIRIDGEVEMALRQERVNEFQNNKEIMAALLSISAAGVGLTLTASSTVVFAELHWTPGMLIQAQDRAHRIGQKNCVNCHYLIGEGTLDNTLYNYLLKKISNVSTFVDGAEQQLQIEQLSKGEKGKFSKSAVDAVRDRLERKSLGIAPIRRSTNINIQAKREENSQATDISSQLTHNPFAERDEEETASLKSRRRLPATIYDEEGNALDHIRSKKLKTALPNRVSQKVNECFSQSQDSLRTSQILMLMEEDEKIKSSKSHQFSLENLAGEDNKSVQVKIQASQQKGKESDTDFDQFPRGQVP